VKSCAAGRGVPANLPRRLAPQGSGSKIRSGIELARGRGRKVGATASYGTIRMQEGGPLRKIWPGSDAKGGEQRAHRTGRLRAEKILSSSLVGRQRLRGKDGREGGEKWLPREGHVAQGAARESRKHRSSPNFIAGPDCPGEVYCLREDRNVDDRRKGPKKSHRHQSSESVRSRQKQERKKSPAGESNSKGGLPQNNPH